MKGVRHKLPDSQITIDAQICLQSSRGQKMVMATWRSYIINPWPECTWLLLAIRQSCCPTGHLFSLWPTPSIPIHFSCGLHLLSSRLLQRDPCSDRHGALRCPVVAAELSTCRPLYHRRSLASWYMSSQDAGLTVACKTTLTLPLPPAGMSSIVPEGLVSEAGNLLAAHLGPDCQVL